MFEKLGGGEVDPEILDLDLHHEFRREVRRSEKR
jgi:hypothetical protein